MKQRYDVVIAGAGHNGLIAAAYLLNAGLSVLTLERRENLGGASISKRVFPEFDANISAYSYLIGLWQQKITKDLGLEFTVKQRQIGSFTPTARKGRHDGLIISNQSETETEESFYRITGNRSDYRGYQKLYEMTDRCGKIVRPTLLKPLLTKAAFRQLFKNADAMDVWKAFFEKPLGECIEDLIEDDVVRGVAFTDAKIGMLTHPHDQSLLQNLIFLYHVIGDSTSGGWWVPVGGMGQLINQLKNKIFGKNGVIISNAEVTHIEPGLPFSTVTYATSTGREFTTEAKYILVNADPRTLTNLLPAEIGYSPGTLLDGTTFKINMLLKRLPALKSGILAEKALSGTVHIDEGYNQMIESYRLASNGFIPNSIPGEMYCHTLTDRTILSEELAEAGYHSLTYFGLDVPAKSFRYDNTQNTEATFLKCIKGINRYLDEDIRDCLARDSKGKLCIEAKSPVDLENELRLPGGNIFHGNLTWFHDDQYAGQWGVEIPDLTHIIFCGSGAKRGGCVSGIPGHNAAMKILEDERITIT